MNRLKVISNRILIVGMLFSFCSTGVAQETLTLDECLLKVRAANPDTRQLELTNAQREALQKINAMHSLPQLALNGKATWQSDVTSIPLEVPGFQIPKPDHDQYAATLDLSQSIYDGGVTHARRNVLEQEASVSTIQYQTGLQFTEDLATDLFFQIAMQQQLVNTSGLLIQQLSNTINTLENLYENGVITKRDVLAPKVKLKEAEQKQQEAEFYQSMGESSLAILMGEPDTDFEIELNAGSTIEEDADHFSSRSEIKLLDARAELLEANEDLSRAQYHPRVSAFASLGYGKPGLDFLSDEFDTYALAGINVNIPLSQLYNRKASRESQVFQLQKSSLELSKEKLVRDFTVKEQQRVTEIDKLESWLVEDELIITMRREILEVSTAQHEGGTITTTDYLNEIHELSLAEERHAIHLVMLEREKAMLLNLYGTRTLLNH